MDEPQIVLDVNDFADEAPVVEQESTAPDSSPAETTTPEVAADSEETDTEAETETEEASNETDTEAEEQPQGKAEDRKTQLNTEIRDLVSQRNAIKAQVEQMNQQVYQPQSVEDLVNEGYSEAEARLSSMEQREELRNFNERVAEAQLTIGTESQRVLQDFPLFNPDSPQFKPEIHARAAQLLSQNLIRDQNTGQVIGSNVSPYQLYQTIDEAYQASAVENQIKGQQATNKMLANADVPSGVVPKAPKQDPFLSGLTKGYNL